MVAAITGKYNLSHLTQLLILLSQFTFLATLCIEILSGLSIKCAANQRFEFDSPRHWESQPTGNAFSLEVFEPHR